MADEPDDVKMIGIPIQWSDPSESPTVYPTNLVIQHTTQEFILHFYSIDLPLFFGTDAEKLEQAKKLTSIPAKALVRVILTPGRMSEFLKLMNDNVANFTLKMEKMAAASEVKS